MPCYMHEAIAENSSKHNAFLNSEACEIKKKSMSVIRVKHKSYFLIIAMIATPALQRQSKQHSQLV